MFLLSFCSFILCNKGILFFVGPLQSFTFLQQLPSQYLRHDESGLHHILHGRGVISKEFAIHPVDFFPKCSATSFLRNWDSILEKKRANLRSISEPARLRQPPPRSTGAAHARGRAQSIREERRIAAPPVLFALLWVRLLPALYGPFCGPLRPFGGCPWGVTPPARECLPPAPPDTRRRG